MKIGDTICFTQTGKIIGPQVPGYGNDIPDWVHHVIVRVGDATIVVHDSEISQQQVPQKRTTLLDAIFGLFRRCWNR